MDNVPHETIQIMGYTNAWYRTEDFTEDQWKDITEETKIIISAATEGRLYPEAGETKLDVERCDPSLKVDYPIDLGDGCGDGDPVVGDTIELNGVGEDSHESFYIPRKLDRTRERKGEVFDFCKTNRKPYDAVVVSILAVMKKIAPKVSRATSNGDGDVEGSAIVYKF